MTQPDETNLTEARVRGALIRLAKPLVDEDLFYLAAGQTMTIPGGVELDLMDDGRPVALVTSSEQEVEGPLLYSRPRHQNPTVLALRSQANKNLTIAATIVAGMVIVAVAWAFLGAAVSGASYYGVFVAVCFAGWLCVKAQVLCPITDHFALATIKGRLAQERDWSVRIEKHLVDAYEIEARRNGGIVSA